MGKEKTENQTEWLCQAAQIDDGITEDLSSIPTFIYPFLQQRKKGFCTFSDGHIPFDCEASQVKKPSW